MSGKAIDNKIILNRDGQTQGGRMPEWLPPESVPLDDRSPEDLWTFAKNIADQVRFFDADTLAANGTWKEFFDLDPASLQALIAQKALPANQALFHAFLQLHKEQQRLLNGLTKRHLDFYYGEVLGLQKAAAFPHRAHVLFTLKQNTASVLLPAGTRLVGGKEIYYSLLQDTIVNNAAVASLRSVFVNPVQKNAIHFAPVANSKDGLGEPLDPLQPKWKGFGDATLPLAKLGFALSSTVLRLKEGTRTITTTLELENVSPPSPALLANLLQASLTGEKGWTPPVTLTPTMEKGTGNRTLLTLSFSLTAEDPAVVDYNAALHGLSIDAAGPVLQILFNNSKDDYGYEQLKKASLVAATIDVDVIGVKDLQLENDTATLNPKKPFLPFGPTPDDGANFSIGCPEAFSKKLKRFSVDVNWKAIPEANLANLYKNYTGYNISNASFTVTASFRDGSGWSGSENKRLFGNNATAPVTLSFSNPSFAPKFPLLSFPLKELELMPVKKAGLSVAASLHKTVSVLQPSLLPQLQLKNELLLNWIPFFLPADTKKGALSLRLNQSFLFREYREIYANAVVAASKQPGSAPALPKEPFAPEVQSLSLNYTATTGRVALNTASLSDYISSEVRFYHFGAFGQMREHLYLHTQANSASADLNLLPQYTAEGELYIGLTGVQAGESVSLLLQVAEGSANPDKEKVPVLWSVLCDNFWKPLDNSHLVSDTTDGLLTSGVVNLLLPSETTNSNTLLPAGFVWLKAAVQNNTDAVSELVDVQANAAIVQYVDDGRHPEHLDTPLPPSSISKLEIPVGSIKTVMQPYSSFGGRPKESDEAFYIRVSERLRHKERSIALWDDERLVLQHFPQVHKVKCIPHADGKSFYEPGHTLTVVVPDLRNQNAVNPFQPRADKATLEGIKRLLQTHSSPWVEHHVTNPQYEPVKVAASIALVRGKEAAYYKKEAERRLQLFLSPWLSDAGKDIVFGGKLTKSMLVQFLESLAYVDYIVDLKLFHSPDGGRTFGSDTEVVEAANPAAILVSHAAHEINPVA